MQMKKLVQLRKTKEHHNSVQTPKKRVSRKTSATVRVVEDEEDEHEEAEDVEVNIENNGASIHLL